MKLTFALSLLCLAAALTGCSPASRATSTAPAGRFTKEVVFRGSAIVLIREPATGREWLTRVEGGFIEITPVKTTAP